MKAIILAGGRGTRLKQPGIPKPMININGTPLLELLIAQLVASGIQEIFISVGYKKEIIMDYFSNGRKHDCKIEYLIEDEPLGTAGSIIKHKNLFSNSPFLVIYGDLLLDINWNNFLAASQKNGGLATLFCHPNSHPFDSDLININEKSEITEIYRKPHSHSFNLPNLSNAAIYYINPKILDGFPVTKLDWAHDIFPNALNKGVLHAYNSIEYACDIGTPSRLNKGLGHVAKNLPNKLSSSIEKPVVFFDRDGVINHEINGVTSPDQIQIIDGVPESIKRLNDRLVPVICISNQPLIAKGKITERELIVINNRISNILADANSSFINDWFYCPHHPEDGWPGEIKSLKINCECRKPKPGLFYKAALRHNINLNDSFMVGDRYCDVEAANLAGINSILISSGHSGNDKDKFPSTIPNYSVNSIEDAVSIMEEKLDYYPNTITN